MGGNPAARGSTNSNTRGNSKQRAARRRRLLERDGTGPDGIALCSTCPTIVDFDTMTVDCWPVPRADGGQYGFSVKSDGGTRIQCERCACRQGGLMGSARREAKRKATFADQVNAIIAAAEQIDILELAI